MSSGKDWRWANESLNASDGEIVIQCENVPEDLSEYLHGLDSNLKVAVERSESPGARLWLVLAPAKGTKDQDSVESAYTKISLGKPKLADRWFSAVRTWSPWLAPRHGRAPFDPKQGAILSSFLRSDGLHLVLLAVSGVKDILNVLEGDGHGNVIANIRNDRPGEGEAYVLAAAAKTFDAATAAVMYHARHVVGAVGLVEQGGQKEIETLLTKEVKAQWQENWYDGLTYCTWNSLGQDLTEEKIFKALADLKKNNIHVTNLIIDDNWQSLQNVGTGESQFDLGWSDFDANQKGFPGGLKQTTSHVRENYPNIKHIAVWHAILGYWGGLDPKGKIAKSYKTKTVNRDGNRKMTVIAAEDVDRMYDDFYKFLDSVGIDSVKTDAQFMLDEIVDAPERRELITATQDAWTIAALRYFSIKVISCMSQFPQNLFHTQLPTNKPTFMVRNSDDFFPNIPSSHPYHLWTNAYNTLFTSYLNIIPDWDMFQTSHDYSYYHATGRCISGGPVYITDEPGKHNLDLITQMTATDVHGKTIVLRPSTLGKSINIYTAYEEERFLKVGAFHGSTGGTSIVALFNVSERSILELVHLASFPGIEPKEEYVVRAHTSGQVSPPISLEGALPIISVELDVKESDVLSAYPIHTFKPKSSAKTTRVAALGLLKKLTGAAAVLGRSYRLDEHGRASINVTLKALGKLGIWIEGLGDKSYAKKALVLVQNQPLPEKYVEVGEDSVLEIDVEGAWNDLKIQPGYNNELSVLVVYDL